MGARQVRNADCAIEQAAAVVGDWWSLLVLREIAGGVHRFDQLQAELQISTKILAARLQALTVDGVVHKRSYSQRPPRFEYHLTERGNGLLPVIVALQSWGSQHLLGDGTLTATATADSAEAHRVHGLVGQRIPVLKLRVDSGDRIDPVDTDSTFTIIYCFPGAFAPGQEGHPDGWADIPGAQGCTLESTTYRDHRDAFAALGASIRGVSTQRADQQRAFSAHARLPFALLSDVELTLTAALRLPTVHVAGIERLKRLTLVVDNDRVIRHVAYPIVDPAASVRHALRVVSDLVHQPTRDTQ